MNTMADGAAQRLVAQIGEALFGQPGLDLMELAEKVKGMATPDGHAAALHAAVSAIYFDDSSDYLSGLWTVVCALDPAVGKLLEHDPAAAYEATKPGQTALAAQPSPVGQGDALATLQQQYDKLLAAFDRQVEAAEKIAATALEQDDRIEELEEALAARQPVGQEPVSYQTWRPWKNSWVETTREWYEKDLADGAYPVRALYAAPPAQAVDLGQFRESVICWRDSLSVRASAAMRSASRDVVEAIEDKEQLAVKLLALIDSKAVGK